MTDGDALLAAIRANPEEDTPRLVYADWLQEHGQEERAEFIRVQVEYARLHEHFAGHEATGGNEYCRRCVNAAGMSSLLLGKFRVPRQGPAPFAADCPHRIAGMADYAGPLVEWDWHRGFVCEVRGPAAWWLAHGDAIRRAHPVTRVRLTAVTREDVDAVCRRVLPREKQLVGKLASELFAEVWPGVGFEMPPDPGPVPFLETFGAWHARRIGTPPAG